MTATPLQITDAHRTLVREILAQRLDPDGPRFIDQSAALVASSERTAIAAAHCCELGIAWAQVVILRNALQQLDVSCSRTQPPEILAKIDAALKFDPLKFAGAIVLNAEQVERLKDLATFTTSTELRDEMLAMLERKAVRS